MKIKKTTSYPKGEVIREKTIGDDTPRLIVSGYVAVVGYYETPSGGWREVIHYLLSTGCCLEGNEFDYIAMSDVVLKEFGEGYPINIAQWKSSMAIKYTCHAKGHIRAEDRICHWLLTQGEIFGLINGDDSKTIPKLSQEMIAKTLSTTRVTVTKTLARLREQNYLQYRRDTEGITITPLGKKYLTDKYLSC